MEPIEAQKVGKQLESWLNSEVFVHLEVNPGAYWRSGKGKLKRVHVKGDGPFRVFLEFEDAGLIHVDDLTHMQVDGDMVICTGYDHHDRIARTLEVSTRAFPI